MDAYFIGFLLGQVMSGLSIVAFGMILGLVISVIRTLRKTGSGITIIVYVIKTAGPLIVVIALGWLASQISYNPTAYWLGVGLMIVVSAFILLRRTPKGTVVGMMWYMVKTELAGRKMGDNQKTR